jgi:DDE superfamily endonuclease
MAELRGGAILPELRLYCALRWLAGGSYTDVSLFCGISQASFYRVCWQTIHAICKCEELQLHFPTTLEECQEAAAGFRSISRGEAIVTCVGAIDGYLLSIEAPPKDLVNNVRSYFSGHYQRYGVNVVQAVCDHLSRFTYIAVAGPGVMNDSIAIHEVDIAEKIEQLPFGFCVIVDCAYNATEHLIPLYSGADKLKPELDDFNFFGSQLRIRIEMAFGMSKKWGILWRPLIVSMYNVKYIVEAVARLHNFCIDERIIEAREEGIGEVDPVVEAHVDGRGSLEELAERLAHSQYENLAEGVAGFSANRDNMVLRIQALGLHRQRLA